MAYTNTFLLCLMVSHASYLYLRLTFL
jgi:hypothetical protein